MTFSDVFGLREATTVRLFLMFDYFSNNPSYMTAGRLRYRRTGVHIGTRISSVLLY